MGQRPWGWGLRRERPAEPQDATHSREMVRVDDTPLLASTRPVGGRWSPHLLAPWPDVAWGPLRVSATLGMSQLPTLQTDAQRMVMASHRSSWEHFFKAWPFVKSVHVCYKRVFYFTCEEERKPKATQVTVASQAERTLQEDGGEAGEPGSPGQV